MHKLWLKANGLMQEDIEAWFADNNCDQYKIAPVDWGFFNVEIADDHVAVQFRLAFDANLGVKISLEEEMIAALSAEIATEIDKEILADLRGMARPKNDLGIEIIRTPVTMKNRSM